jgi:ketosteroid isomerase-like protein
LSKKNICLLRRFIASFNKRDLEAMIARIDPDVEWQSAFAALSGATYRGHEGIREWHRDMQEAWGEQIRVEVETYFDLGEHTLTFVVVHGRGIGSELEVAMAAAHVMRWRDGRIVYFRAYRQREDALSDLDLTPDELEPIKP